MEWWSLPLYSPSSSYAILTEKRKFGKLKLIALVQMGVQVKESQLARGTSQIGCPDMVRLFQLGEFLSQLSQQFRISIRYNITLFDNCDVKYCTLNLIPPIITFYRTLQAESTYDPSVCRLVEMKPPGRVCHVLSAKLW